MLYDTIIIGASAAGMSAAIYAARRGLEFVVLSEDIGGEMARSGEVGNYPAVKDTDGITLTEKLKEQMKQYEVEIRDGEKVTSVTKEGNIVKITSEFSSEKRSYESKSVIIATGIHPRELEVPGEKELRGKGVTYCTVCDGPLFKGKTTATVGAGNSALESALMMAGIAQKVYLITKHEDFPKGDAILIKKVQELENVEIVKNALTSKIVGDPMVSGLEYTDKDGATQSLKVQGVMVHIGFIPNSEIVDVDKNEIQEIITDKMCSTSVPGIFAAGDVTEVPYKQIAIAAGSGVCAALSVVDYVNKWEE